MGDDDLIRRGDALAALSLGDIVLDRSAVKTIAALPAVTVRVKPLVWEDFGDWGAKASAYYQANYLIQFWKGREQFEVALSYPGYQTGFDGDRWHHTLDAAKAAAQADYEARILAALEPQPAPDAAANRIEALTEQLAAARRDAEEAEAYAAELEDKLAECEARLGKAVEALGTALSEMVDYADTHPAWSEIWEAREAARATLAEIKGESHD